MADRFGRQTTWAGGLLALLLLVLVVPSCSRGEDAAAAEDLSLLFMLGARSATIDGAAGTLTLAGAEPSATWFADRPERLAGTMSTSDLVEDWDHLFGDDPPNAGLQSLGAADRDSAFVFELLDPPTDDGAGNLTFRVRPIGPPDPSPGLETLQQVSMFVDGGDTATLPVSSATTASPSYSVTVTNNSGQFQTFAIYQQPNDPQLPDAVPLAWLTAPLQPHSTATFHWTETYGLYWSFTGTMVPGVVVVPSQLVPADPVDPATNTIELAETNGALAFAPASTPAPTGSLGIVSAGSVPTGAAAVGIAMSNAPVFAVPADPNRTATFDPEPDYRLTAGFFQSGEVLDVDSISNEVALPFDGTDSLNATLHEDGLWTVERPGG